MMSTFVWPNRIGVIVEWTSNRKSNVQKRKTPSGKLSIQSLYLSCICTHTQKNDVDLLQICFSLFFFFFFVSFLFNIFVIVTLCCNWKKNFFTDLIHSIALYGRFLFTILLLMILVHIDKLLNWLGLLARWLVVTAISDCPTKN